VDKNNIRRLALPSVAKDVQAVRDVMVHPERCAYEPDNVKLIMGEESSNKNILDALYWLQDKVKEDAEATAVIYYSGHGMVDNATDQYYLIPYDIRSLSRVRADAIKADTLTAEISSIKAKRMLVILDCCHAGGMGVKDVDLAAIDDGADVKSAPFPIDLPETKDIPAYEAAPGAKDVSDLLDGNGRAILNSSTDAQSSYVRKDGKMSVFTYHLIEALTGHAPHPEDASVVYVTDVMSWVTHEVKKSAKREGVDQTPVMRTSGVFPIAQLIGGQGLAAKGLSGVAPDPLASLPSIQVGHAEGAVIGGDVDMGGGDFAGRDMHKGDEYHGDVDKSTTTFNMEGQTVEGNQINAAGDVTIDHLGDKVEMGSGDFVKGDKNIHGDVVQGDKVMGDKVDGDKVGGDNITVGNISGGQGIAIGRGASASVSIQHGMAASDDPNKQALQKLIQQLEQALSQVPEAHGDSAEAVAQTTQALVKMAEEESPNKTMLQITGEGLKQAAKNLAEITPDVLTIATGIVGTILKITGIG
ncbi:MAG: caspase family protein, partial [Chloroflexi bacterium]|nr:caspase family protein [Chloroflexota bacterium]